MNLQAEIILLADVSCQVDDGLHALYLSLDIHVEVFTFHFWEAEEVDRTRIPSSGVLRNELT
jgi:hypothetical protein